ncbi:unnamed protein product [Bodo saltans]|uniref:Thymidylate kinase-like domain-containing protein n=1 Tax=Bodo saltans TaxID=75058 RepID=A0A0S4KK84_BODSA|nr:unnamed protein product [Bodo saltans]|eukprot:CUI14998.1 unnamed protein product [Bodo saltans]
MKSLIKYMTVFVDRSVDPLSEQLIRKVVPPSATIVPLVDGHPSWIHYWEATKGDAALDRVSADVKPLNRFTCFVTSKHLACPDVSYALYAMKVPTLSLFADKTTDIAMSPSPFFSDLATLQVAGIRDAIHSFFTFPETLGRLFVIEGGDGSGKETQTKLLVARLRKEGYRTETLDFPHDAAPSGEVIREALAGHCGTLTNLPKGSFALIYSFNRFERRSELIYWVQRGVNVIVDRYTSANFGYQLLNVEEGDRKDAVQKLINFEVDVLGLPGAHRVAYLQLDPLQALMAILQDDTRRELDMYEKYTVERKTDIMNLFKWCCTNLEGWTCVQSMEGDAAAGTRIPREVMHETLFQLWQNEFVKPISHKEEDSAATQQQQRE